MQQLDRTDTLGARHLLFTVYRVTGDNPFLHGGDGKTAEKRKPNRVVRQQYSNTMLPSFV